MPRTAPPDLRALVAEAHRGWPARGGGPKAVKARAALAKLLWKPSGERRLPALASLDKAIEGLARGDLDWICEFSPLGPLYILPNTRWVKALAQQLHELRAKKILEVAAGDGFLTRALKQVDPTLDVVASDSGGWEQPEARMNAAERKRLKNKLVAGIRIGEDVLRMEARAAIRKVRPDVVLASWLPPGPMLDQLIRAKVPYVLEIGAAGGVTSSAWSWRFNHEFLEGPLEDLARCRLDVHPKYERHTRVTLYYGAAHPEHHLERVRPGDWLWQYRPVE